MIFIVQATHADGNEYPGFSGARSIIARRAPTVSRKNHLERWKRGPVRMWNRVDSWRFLRAGVKIFREYAPRVLPVETSFVFVAFNYARATMHDRCVEKNWRDPIPGTETDLPFQRRALAAFIFRYAERMREKNRSRRSTRSTRPSV